jgi:hypothetical protein
MLIHLLSEFSLLVEISFSGLISPLFHDADSTMTFTSISQWLHIFLILHRPNDMKVNAKFAIIQLQSAVQRNFQIHDANFGILNTINEVDR